MLRVNLPVHRTLLDTILEKEKKNWICKWIQTCYEEKRNINDCCSVKWQGEKIKEDEDGLEMLLHIGSANCQKTI